MSPFKTMQRRDTSWGVMWHFGHKIIDAEIEAQNHPSRKYHNSFHLATMLEWAKVFGMPYDRNLEAAIIWHDRIYDAESEHKEADSVAAFRRIHDTPAMQGLEIDADVVENLIMSTKDHLVCAEFPDDRLIRLDLADLTHPLRRIENIFKIEEETQLLYGVDNASAQAYEFLDGLDTRMLKNHSNSDYFWQDVREGLQEVMGVHISIIDAPMKFSFER